MNRKEEKEQLLKLLQKIRHKTALVEGQRDAAVLRSLGFKRVVALTKGLWETAEQIADKEILILTDFDAEGEQLAARLGLFLQARRIKVDRASRRKLKFAFVKLGISAVEEIKPLLKQT